jgi:hypothetical protein
MKKEVRLISLGILLILFLGIVYSYSTATPNPGHTGEDIFVAVSGKTQTLQTAINNKFNGSGATTSSLVQGHSGNEILVSVKGKKQMLQVGIENRFNGNGVEVTSLNPGHDGSSILISVKGVEKTLQQAIDDGDLSCTPNCAGKKCGDNGCGGVCGSCTNYQECVSGQCECTLLTNCVDSVWKNTKYSCSTPGGKATLSYAYGSCDECYFYYYPTTSGGISSGSYGCNNVASPCWKANTCRTSFVIDLNSAIQTPPSSTNYGMTVIDCNTCGGQCFDYTKYSCTKV